MDGRVGRGAPGVGDRAGEEGCKSLRRKRSCGSLRGSVKGLCFSRIFLSGRWGEEGDVKNPDQTVGDVDHDWIVGTWEGII